MADKADLPRWAPRVSQAKVRQLYESDARGILDEEIIDEVGYALYARCESILDVTEAHYGRIKCPRCGIVIFKESKEKNEILRCGGCGWELPWREYHKTYQGKNLCGGNAVQVFRNFYEKFPTLRDPREKMLAIDRLIHEFHMVLKDYVRPAAVNLLEGKQQEVIEFLDNLTYGTKEQEESRQVWRERLQSIPWLGQNKNEKGEGTGGE